MSNSLNERIALRRGWRKEPGRKEYVWAGEAWARSAWAESCEWQAPDGTWCATYSDYEHNWEHAGPLLEELLFGMGSISGWRLVLMNLENNERGLPEAIARAWDAWQEESSGV